MSAWIVSKKHIDLLVTARVEYITDPVVPTEFGKMLWEENHRSVNIRYSEHTPTPDYQWQPIDLADYPPLCILKQIACYDYQTCESDDWNETEAYKAVTALAEAVKNRNGLSDDYSGEREYDNAPWGID